MGLNRLQMFPNLALNPLESVGTMPSEFYTLNYLIKLSLWVVFDISARNLYLALFDLYLALFDLYLALFDLYLAYLPSLESVFSISAQVRNLYLASECLAHCL